MLDSPGWRGSSVRYFSLGLFFGGLTVGFAAGLVGAVVPSSEIAALWLLSSLAVFLFLDDLGWIRLPLPQNARQVPRTIERRGSLVAAFQFGFEMGTGMRTYVTASAPYFLLGAVILLVDLGTAVLAGVGFGVGRATMTSLRFLSGDVEAWAAALALRLRFVSLTCLALTVLVLPVSLAS